MCYILEEELTARFPNTKFFLVTGDTKNKQEIVDKFNSLEDSNAILVGSDALNYGFNIETADVIINFDFPWTPSKLTQRTGRGDRITRKTKLLVVDLITKNSFEERILRILRRKNEYIKKSFGDRDIVNEIFKN